MARRDRNCYLCGEEYKYCPTCSQDKMKPTWMGEFHAENCKNIFDICTRFNMQMLTKDQAKSELDACDLSNKANFKPFVQRDLENIYKEEPVFKRGKRAEAHILDDVAEATHEVVEQ